MKIDDEDLLVDKNGVATIHVQDAPVIDQLTFLGPGTEPATASFDIRWTPTGAERDLTPPANAAPTDPQNLTADFRLAQVEGSFTVKKGSVTYTGAWGGSTGAGIDFAEIGTEQNGIFTHAHHQHRIALCPLCR